MITVKWQPRTLSIAQCIENPYSVAFTLIGSISSWEYYDFTVINVIYSYSSCSYYFDVILTLLQWSNLLTYQLFEMLHLVFFFVTPTGGYSKAILKELSQISVSTQQQ